MFFFSFFQENVINKLLEINEKLIINDVQSAKLYIIKKILSVNR